MQVSSVAKKPNLIVMSDFQQRSPRRDINGTDPASRQWPPLDTVRVYCVLSTTKDVCTLRKSRNKVGGTPDKCTLLLQLVATKAKSPTVVSVQSRHSTCPEQFSEAIYTEPSLIQLRSGRRHSASEETQILDLSRTETANDITVQGRSLNNSHLRVRGSTAAS